MRNSCRPLDTTDRARATIRQPPLQRTPEGFAPHLAIASRYASAASRTERSDRTARVWAGFLDYDAAVRCRKIVLEGPSALVQAFPRWFMWSPLVDVAREYRERRTVSA